MPAHIIRPANNDDGAFAENGGALERSLQVDIDREFHHVTITLGGPPEKETALAAFGR